MLHLSNKVTSYPRHAKGESSLKAALSRKTPDVTTYRMVTFSAWKPLGPLTTLNCTA